MCQHQLFTKLHKCVTHNGLLHWTKGGDWHVLEETKQLAKLATWKEKKSETWGIMRCNYNEKLMLFTIKKTIH